MHFFFFSRNYNTELIAFQARLGEKFDDNTLRQAFISLEYVTAQQKKLLELQNINSLGMFTEIKFEKSLI